jgi:hypothetical protein
MKREETLSIMQPYAFPYFGYFCLIESSDMIVFYDDVNHIKRGWINRNKILLNNEPYQFNIYLKDASQNKEIREVMLLNDDKKTLSTLRTIQQAYSKAPYYKSVFPYIAKVFAESNGNISDFAIDSIKVVYEYLDLPFNYRLSSEISPFTKGEEKSLRLANITKQRGYKNYINVMGGKDLYNKEQFSEMGVNLYFNKPILTQYKQWDDKFHPYLSIIDIMMFCSKEEIIKMIQNFETI